MRIQAVWSRGCLTLWRLAAFGDFREKKRLNARGFVREYLRWANVANIYWQNFAGMVHLQYYHIDWYIYMRHANASVELWLLTRLLPVYENFTPKNPAWTAIFAPQCNYITCQSIVLESCSNPQKTQQVFKSAMTKKFGFGLQVFLWVRSQVT